MKFVLDFAIIGAMKAGTSTLGATLRKNPQVCLVPGLFGQRIDLHGDEATEAHKAWVAPIVETARTEGRQVGHVRANYFVNGSAMEEIVASEATKVIFVYRDPVDRLWSHYNHELRMGTTWRNFGAWLGSEEGKRGIAYSQYTKQLSQIAPALASRLKVMHMRQTTDPESLGKLCQFLGISPAEHRINPANVGGSPWSPFLNYTGRRLTRLVYPEPCGRRHRLDKMRTGFFSQRGKKLVMSPDDAARAADVIGEEKALFERFLEHFPEIQLGTNTV